jgi:nucleotide-binding universal stress UspA family protein
MALKDILIYLDPSEDSLDDLNLGAELAALHSSHFTALFIRQWSDAQYQRGKHAELGLASAETIQALDREIERSIESTAERLRSALDILGRQRGMTTEWICRNGPAAQVVPSLARYFDLCILGVRTPRFLSETLALETGRPVAILPRTHEQESLGRHIAIAWNASRAATRAVNDALPLIELAQRTSILIVDGADSSDDLVSPVERIAEHIRRHAPAVDTIRISLRPGQSIARALQHEARQIGADLLVAGAFGHSKLRESIVGGVTRDLIDEVKMPLFLAH